jgi:hypothetical protein
VSEQQKFESKTWADAEVTKAPGREQEPEQDNEDNNDAAAEAEPEEKSWSPASTP